MGRFKRKNKVASEEAGASARAAAPIPNPGVGAPDLARDAKTGMLSTPVSKPKSATPPDAQLQEGPQTADGSTSGVPETPGEA